MEASALAKIKGAIDRSSNLMEELANLYKVFSDPSRVKILCSLTQSDLCVSEIALILNISQSAVSHQLSILKTSNLVKTQRKGKMIVYSLADDHVRTIIDCGMEHITE